MLFHRLGEIRLRDFKSAVGESNLYHYYFKAFDPEYGQVKEEVCYLLFRLKSLFCGLMEAFETSLSLLNLNN